MVSICGYCIKEQLYNGSRLVFNQTNIAGEAGVAGEGEGENHFFLSINLALVRD